MVSGRLGSRRVKETKVYAGVGAIQEPIGVLAPGPLPRGRKAINDKH